MKAVQTRENIRKLKLNPHQSKEVQSQSPPHKKLLKKIEMIHKEPTHKTDLSLKENLLAKEPQEEPVVDFRVEIERRFNKAPSNQIFKFPRRPSASDRDGTSSSTDSSFESLKHVTIYDLSSQNKKKKNNVLAKNILRAAVTDEKRMPKSVTHRTQTGIDVDLSDDSIGFEEEERSGVPIEIRVRDKTTATYRKLLGLIDHQLNPAPEVQPPSDVLRAQLAKKQQNNQEQQHSSKALAPERQEKQVTRENNHSEYNKSNTKTMEDHHDVEIHKLEPFKTKKERNVRSQGRHDRPHYSESQRASKAVSNSGLQIAKKNLSQEKMTKIETVPTLGFSGIEKTLSRLNISTAKGDSKTTVDLSKLTQDSFKKLYNNSLLKSATPQYAKSSKIANLKENMFKAYAQENPSSNVKTTMDNLYQKAKNEVINHKLKVSGVNLTRSHMKIGNNSMSATKRDETPKDAARKINFNNFYGNTDIILDKSGSKAAGHSSQSMSKKESMKAFQVASPYKKQQPVDSPIYASYEFSQPKVAKKPSFKLDLNKRGQAYREAVSSARNRKKRTPDKFSDVLNTESAIRNSYDMQQFSYILNSSSQKNTGKKQIGFTPSSVAKNMSFTKAFFSFK